MSYVHLCCGKKVKSPEPIANTVLKGVASFKTIYRCLLPKTDLSALRQKRKHREPRETRSKSKGYFSTLVERKTRMVFAYKMPDRSAINMKNSILELSNSLPREAFQRQRQRVFML